MALGPFFVVLCLVVAVGGIGVAEEPDILARLYRENLLTAEEFRSGKAKVLADDRARGESRPLLPSSERRELEQTGSPSLADKLASSSMWLKSQTAQITMGAEGDVSLGRGSDEDGANPHLAVHGHLAVDGDLRLAGQISSAFDHPGFNSLSYDTSSLLPPHSPRQPDAPP